MDFDRPMSDAADQTAAANPEATSRDLGCPGAASVYDVMFDQLQYLIDHTDGACPAGCLECRRLQQVSDWLLRPFRAAGRD